MPNLIFCLLLIVHYTKAKTMLTMYQVEVENVMPCMDNNKLESPLKNFQFKRINRTTKAMSYDVTFKRPLDENVGGLLILERLGNAGWVQIPFMPFCPDQCNTNMRFFKATAISFNTALGVAEPDKCPIPAGHYKMRNFIIDLSAVKVPTWGGKYRLQQLMQTVDARKTIFCMSYLVNIKEIL